MVYEIEIFCLANGKIPNACVVLSPENGQNGSFSRSWTENRYSNNLDDVREEWERIKLSYEILSDKKTRKRYDRHAMLANPGAAMGRAAFDAVGKGITGLGLGLFSVGAFAVRQITKEQTVEDAK